MGKSSNKIENLIKSYNDFIMNTYGEKERYTAEDLKKDLLLPLAYTQEEDNKGIFEYEKQISYDIEKEQQINQLYNEYIQVINRYSYPFENISNELGDLVFEDFVTLDSFNVDIDDLSNHIYLLAYTNNDSFIKEYAVKHNLEIEEINFEYIFSRRDILLPEIDDEVISMFNDYGIEYITKESYKINGDVGSIVVDSSGNIKKINREYFQQGYIYKNERAFYNKQGICYIPELSDKGYTYQDLIEITDRDNDKAEIIFDMVDWQHPESLYTDLKYDVEPDERKIEIIERDNELEL